MFLNVVPDVSNWNSTGTEFSLILQENPMLEFVELPQDLILNGLKYSQVIAGIIRGALEMLHMQVDCEIAQCPLLKPGSPTEIRVKFVKRLEDELPPADF
jgi:trafficking protein particle complex subunit 3